MILNNKKENRLNSGLIAVIVLVLLPVVLWLAIPSSVPRFSFNNAIFNLGKLTALTGAVLFAINIILSARPRFLERHFNGLNLLYDNHKIIGQTALVLLLLHPLLLVSRYAGNNWQSALAFLLPGDSLETDLGTYALWIMVLLIVITLYLRPRYDIWKITHKFLGLAFFLASLHIWLIPSDVSTNLPLRVYMLGISGIALLVFIYKSLLGRWLIPVHHYIVSRVAALNDQVVEISLEPVKNTLRFQPGQSVYVSFLDRKIGQESHPFSITSAPGQKELTFAIKKLGDYTDKIDTLSVGSIAKLEGPFGKFILDNSRHRKQVWIAGGIGIAPFLSMAKDLEFHDGYQVDLYYCTKNANEFIHMEELQALSGKIQNRFRLFPYTSETQGRISVEYIEKNSGLAGTDFFICAPPPMIRSLRSRLMEKGVPRQIIHSEEFSY